MIEAHMGLGCTPAYPILFYVPLFQMEHQNPRIRGPFLARRASWSNVFVQTFVLFSTLPKNHMEGFSSPQTKPPNSRVFRGPFLARRASWSNLFLQNVLTNSDPPKKREDGSLRRSVFYVCVPGNWSNKLRMSACCFWVLMDFSFM